ncbi:MAG: polyketide synthase dehydratase domain-containing protein, partial [Anaerolineales bacterium]|nr:polyketide synthase dehydratase domain-containing protein [Anaerolineales bacterium]
AAALWTQEVKTAMGFPLGIGSVTAYRQPTEAAGSRLYALLQTTDDGETFDAQVVDEAGNVFVDLKGYRTISRPM